MLYSAVCLLAALGLASCGYSGGGGGGYPGGGIVGGAPIGQGVGGGVSGGFAPGAAPCSGPQCGPDFNPILLGGNKGYPGLRARINQRSFQYASGIVGDLLNSEIKKARIPPISQCIPQVNGCIQIYNLYVSRYRCPQRVVLYPAAPNRLILQVQNVDIGVTGNLGGQIVVLIPIALTGIVQLNLHQVTITVDLAVERTATGSPYIRMQSCNVQIGYADAYLENAGLIGDIVNSQFRSRLSQQVKQMIPEKVCAQLPSIINEKLNSKLAGLPQTIALTQMASMFGGALGLGGSSSPSQQYCSQQCAASAGAALPIGGGSSSAPAQPIVSAPISAPAAAPEIPHDAYGGRKVFVRAAASQPQYKTNAQQLRVFPVSDRPSLRLVPLRSNNGQVQYSRVPNSVQQRTDVHNLPMYPYDQEAYEYDVEKSSDNAFVAVQRAALIKQMEEALDAYGVTKIAALDSLEQALEPPPRVKRQSQLQQQVMPHPLQPAPHAIYRAARVVQPHLQPQPQMQQQHTQMNMMNMVRRQAPMTLPQQQMVQHQQQPQQQQLVRVQRGGGGGGIPHGLAPSHGPVLPPPPPVPGAPTPQVLPLPANLCSQCPHKAAASGDDPAGFIKQLAAHMDLSKLNDMYLSLQLLNTYATSNDFTIDLTGEFSPYGQGGTPFGAFPTQFPSAYDSHMAEFIVSDYTLNSLFYHMHRKGFISFRIGPETPKIGDLLKTTCSDDEDEELEDHGVELDDEESERRKLRRHIPSHKTHKLLKRSHIRFGRNSTMRKRRQDEEGGGLADLGICFGDILPAVREKYPNQKINIHVHTVRAPSVLLSAQRGGMATIVLIADADIYIDGTNTRVGTITITAVVEVVVQVQGNRISGHAEITTLKLADRTGTLGLPQDALDNLGNLGKELLQKLANDALGKGINVNIPQTTGLPFTIINPQFQIVEHGLYIATDLTVNVAALGLSGGC